MIQKDVNSIYSIFCNILSSNYSCSIFILHIVLNSIDPVLNSHWS